MKYAPGFIFAKASAFMIPRVLSFRSACIETSAGRASTQSQVELKGPRVRSGSNSQSDVASSSSQLTYRAEGTAD